MLFDHLKAVARKAEQTPMPTQPHDTEGEPLPQQRPQVRLGLFFLRAADEVDKETTLVVASHCCKAESNNEGGPVRERMLEPTFSAVTRYTLSAATCPVLPLSSFFPFFSPRHL